MVPELFNKQNIKTERWPDWELNPGPTGHIPDALPTELSGLTRFNTNVINITMASVLPPSDHCYQGTGVDLIQHIAMLRGTPRLHNHPTCVRLYNPTQPPNLIHLICLGNLDD